MMIVWQIQPTCSSSGSKDDGLLGLNYSSGGGWKAKGDDRLAESANLQQQQQRR
jgi:hypothetical protein